MHKNSQTDVARRFHRPFLSLRCSCFRRALSDPSITAQLCRRLPASTALANLKRRECKPNRSPTYRGGRCSMILSCRN